MSKQSPIRLQKFLAAAGVASRRKSEGLIIDGHIRVNGHVITELGMRVNPAHDQVECDGKPVVMAAASEVIMLNKPRDYICSTNEEQGRTIYDLLPRDRRLIPIGRLDKQSEGLLLLTNDGELANKLIHPRYGHEKCYHVSVRGEITAQRLEALRKPMVIDDYRIRPCDVDLLELRERETVLCFTLREGRNRQIRQMCEAVNLQVIRLVRVSFATLTLGDLPQGNWRTLYPDEVASLHE
jgi:23S rRNA pseudouridine2605 synthase